MSASAYSPPVSRDARAIGTWLIGVAVMVFAMMLIGAITRLTESGLSMVEWRPLIGAVPPLSAAEWSRVFELYRQTSEYRLANAGMTLAEFKEIFWWEYIHRLWGRLIGLAYALPFFWFLARGRVPSGYRGHLWALLVLGGLQGVVGWWMVASGFVDRTDVSQYRLALHLGLAFAIFAYLIYVALKLMRPRAPAPAAGRWVARAYGLMALTAVTVLSGALVAGLNAGFVYNSWPLMDGAFFYRDWFLLDPWWRNAFENIGAVQFDHRMLAYAAVAAALAFWIAARRDADAPAGLKRAAACIAAMAAAQMGLGILTLLSVVQMGLAVLHQAGAAILTGLCVWAVFEARAARQAAAARIGSRADGLVAHAEAAPMPAAHMDRHR